MPSERSTQVILKKAFRLPVKKAIQIHCLMGHPGAWNPKQHQNILINHVVTDPHEKYY